MTRFAIVAIIALAPALAYAHGKASGIVRERMDAMVTLKDTLKALKPMLVSGGEYDAEAVIRAARVVESHAGEAMTKLFPVGSTQHSEALPSVWEQPERFAELAEDLNTYAVALRRSAEAGVPNEGSGSVFAGLWSSGDKPDAEALAGLPPLEAFKRISENCAACHEDFRKEK